MLWPVYIWLCLLPDGIAFVLLFGGAKACLLRNPT